MIEQLRLRGAAGSVLWGYRPIAELASWAIVRDDAAKLREVRREGHPGRRGQPFFKKRAGKAPPALVLKAYVRRFDSFQIKQAPLFFVAPRSGGFWNFPIVERPSIENGVLRAKLGFPEASALKK